MNSNVQSLKAFLAGQGRIALVEVAGTKGSTPREKGAFMIVSASAILGTIGGGQLEYMAIDKARQMLFSPLEGEMAAKRPEGALSEGTARALNPVDPTPPGGFAATLPHVYIFGGGHVGQALASAVALLPVHAVVIETRAEALEGMPETVETRLTPMPEAIVREAPPGTAFAILTHDHALDFLI
ncbi:MAG: xanthine dehydrogenase accessory protein XdhC, partial [Mesorhizobium sp.]